MAGTVRTLRIGGRRSATVPPGADAVSDAARLRVKPFRDLAVSIHVERLIGGVTFHPFAFQTSYEGTGSHAATRGGAAFTETTRAWPLLSGLDVRAPGDAGGSWRSVPRPWTARARPRTPTTASPTTSRAGSPGARARACRS